MNVENVVVLQAKKLGVGSNFVGGKLEQLFLEKSQSRSKSFQCDAAVSWRLGNVEMFQEGGKLELWIIFIEKSVEGVKVAWSGVKSYWHLCWRSLRFVFDNFKLLADCRIRFLNKTKDLSSIWKKRFTYLSKLKVAGIWKGCWYYEKRKKWTGFSLIESYCGGYT